MDGVLMFGRLRHFFPILFSLPVIWSATACDPTGQAPIPTPSPTTSSSSGGGGEGGGDLGPCGMDCSTIETPQCTVAVCNTGQVLGPLNTCIVVPSPKGTSCDDGKFCTLGDFCDEGACVGGDGENTCGMKADPCMTVVCYEPLKSCDVLPLSDGSECTPKNLCQVNGVCQLGECIGQPKDCSFSPLAECNGVTCEPTTGKCVGAPDPFKNNTPCVLTGDQCRVGKTCQMGLCVGGEPKSCASLDNGCQLGVCDSATGLCETESAPIGTACSEGIAECDVGSCNDKGECIPTAAADNTACNDYNACTKLDKCVAGMCMSGPLVSNCSAYLHEGFETCPPAGWTLGGDWECGTPTNVGPPSGHIGTGVIATQIDDNYHVNQSYNVSVATTPPLVFPAGTTPQLFFWAWDHTEGATFDGWNVKISIDGGQTYTPITTVTPAYPFTIGGQQAWGGNNSGKGWQNYRADLSAYAGQTARVRFAFRSDGASVFPGVYVDEVVIAEPSAIPMYIKTTSPLQDVYTGMDFSAQIERIGGSANAVWSIKSGGQNTAWLSIDSATGVLYGVPTPADVGAVSVTVHVEEPTLPSNFVEETYSFNVKPNTYYTSFEGMCPAGWTLTGDWQCGVPTNVGPAKAYIGTQCLATQLASNYNNLQSFTATTATSPELDLTAAQSPLLTFRMWADTEGGTYDGVNLQVSTDGGMTFTVVTTVSPPYQLMVAGNPAWGGHQAALDWQFMQADLSAYAGQKILLRFAFRSDSSGVFPGVYIDDIFIN